MVKKTWMIGVGLGAAVAAGAVLLATVSPVGLAGAQDESDTTEEQHGRPGVLGEVLDELVAEGTIDQADADAVAGAMEARREEFRADHPGRHGRGHGPWFRGGPGGDELLDALGMTREELRDALAEGQTLEEVAEAAGVDLAELADARLDRAQARLDEALADGSISEERARRAQERLDEARQAIEDGELPLHGPGHRHRWGHHGGSGEDADEDG